MASGNPWQSKPYKQSEVDGRMYCRECGNPMFITSVGVSHHLADETSDEVDHDADADHVAIQDTSL